MRDGGRRQAPLITSATRRRSEQPRIPVARFFDVLDVTGGAVGRAVGDQGVLSLTIDLTIVTIVTPGARGRGSRAVNRIERFMAA